MVGMSDEEELKRLNAIYEELIKDAKSLIGLQTGGLNSPIFIGCLLVFISLLIVYEKLELIRFLQPFSFDLVWWASLAVLILFLVPAFIGVRAIVRSISIRRKYASLEKIRKILVKE